MYLKIIRSSFNIQVDPTIVFIEIRDIYGTPNDDGVWVPWVIKYTLRRLRTSIEGKLGKDVRRNFIPLPCKKTTAFCSLDNFTAKICFLVMEICCLLIIY